MKLHEEKFRDREIRVTRLKTKGQLEKMQKRKMLQASKDILSNKKHKAKKTGISSDKSDKFQKKVSFMFRVQCLLNMLLLKNAFVRYLSDSFLYGII